MKHVRPQQGGQGLENTCRSFACFLVRNQRELSDYSRKVNIHTTCVCMKQKMNYKGSFIKVETKQFCKIYFKNLEIKEISKHICVRIFLCMLNSFCVYGAYAETSVRSSFQACKMLFIKRSSENQNQKKSIRFWAILLLF